MNFLKDNKGTCLQKAGNHFLQAMLLVQVPDPLICKAKEWREWEKAQGWVIYDVNMHEKNDSISDIYFN